MATLYHKLPAQSFRVFELTPARDRTDALRGELITSAFSDNVEYQALSYVWGNSGNTDVVLISGIQLSVSQNLDRALRCVRKRSKTLRLWVDQICINQDHADEKAEQVSLMDKIYAGASKVLVILCACNVLKKESVQRRQRSASFLRKMKKLNKSSLQTHLSESCFNNNPDEVLMIRWFLSYDWWTRMWTVQELVFARRLTFFVHRKVLSGEALRHFCAWWTLHMDSCCRLKAGMSGMLNTELSESVSRASKIFELRERYLKSRATLSLLEMLCMTQDRSASEAHDNVYALASLSQIPRKLITYKTSPVECYTSFTRYIINMSGRLDVFRHLTGPRPLPLKETKSNSRCCGHQGMENLPSWVPDWSLLRNGIGQNHFDWYNRILGNYSAAGNSVVRVDQTTDRSLWLRGIRCTSISKICCTLGDIDPTPEAVLEIWACLGGFESIPRRSLDDSIFSEGDFYDIAGALLGVSGSLASISLILSHGKKKLTENNPMSLPIKNNDSRAQVLYKFIHQVLAQDGHNVDIAAHLLQCIGTRKHPTEQEKVDAMALEILGLMGVMDKQFVVTVDGHYGFASAQAQPGDLVCVFYGGNTPFVLRKDQKNEGTYNNKNQQPAWSSVEHERNPSCRESQNYRMIGDAYLHGLMCGEAVEDVDQQQRSVELFTLV